MSQKASYSKLFVPPKFLERPAVSLDVQSQGISFLTLKKNEKGLLPDIYGLMPLPAGSVVHGEIIKKDQVVKALTDIKVKTKMSFARFSLPEEKTYLFKTRLPDLEQGEIRDILEFKIEENVPLSAKESVFDYDIVPGSRGANGTELVISVSPLKFIEDWQAVFELAGLSPCLFSPEASNVARAVVKKTNEQVIVVASIKESNIIMSLVVRGVVCQTSSVDFGGATFTQALAKHFGISPEEAQKIKKEKLYSDGVLDQEIFSSLINTVSAIKDEIYKFVSYCNAREDVTGNVERVILCGQDAMIAGLDRYLSANLDLNVEVANIWANNFDLASYIPEISKLDSLDLAAVNGLSLL